MTRYAITLDVCEECYDAHTGKRVSRIHTADLLNTH